MLVLGQLSQQPLTDEARNFSIQLVYWVALSRDHAIEVKFHYTGARHEKINIWEL
jgi:hypothetical protein